MLTPEPSIKKKSVSVEPFPPVNFVIIPVIGDKFNI